MKRAAAIAGLAEWKPERIWPRPMFSLEAYAELAALVLEDAGIEKGEVDGLCIGSVYESPLFGPSAAAEYLGIRANFAETVDLGGATSAGMLWRAAAAIEVGACETVLVLCPSVVPPRPDGAARGKMDFPIYLGGDAWGSPQGAFEIPAGLVAATPSYAMVAQRYMARYGLREETLAKIAVDARTNAQSTPTRSSTASRSRSTTCCSSPVVADPLHLLEIVMPCCRRRRAVVVTTPERVGDAPARRPVLRRGLRRAPHAQDASPTRPTLTRQPRSAPAAERAFAHGRRRAHATSTSCQLYDCYTITVLVTLEDAGFCGKGEGEALRRASTTCAGTATSRSTPTAASSASARPGMAGGMLARHRGRAPAPRPRRRRARSRSATSPSSTATAGS